jgi:hypothetical protein
MAVLKFIPLVIAALAYLIWRHFAAQVYVGDLPPFDLRLYAYDAARAYIAGLTDAARAVYLERLHWADLGLMLSVTVTVVLPVWHMGWYWGLPALGYLGFDLLENAIVAGFLRRGIFEVGEVATLSLITGAKFALLAVAAGLAIWGVWRQWRA